MGHYVRDAHVFVDESKTRGYFIAAAAVAAHDAQAADRLIRAHARAGQRRIHFTNESDSSRKNLLSRFAESGVSVTVYAARGLSDPEARKLCLRTLLDDLAAAQAGRLVIEQDDSLMAADRRLIQATLRERDYAGLRYEHARPADHALLWVSDAVAWCYQARGDWIRRAEPLVTEIHRLT